MVKTFDQTSHRRKPDEHMVPCAIVQRSHLLFCSPVGIVLVVSAVSLRTEDGIQHGHALTVLLQGGYVWERDGRGEHCSPVFYTGAVKLLYVITPVLLLGMAAAEDSSTDFVHTVNYKCITHYTPNVLTDSNGSREIKRVTVDLYFSSDFKDPQRHIEFTFNQGKFIKFVQGGVQFEWVQQDPDTWTWKDHMGYQVRYHFQNNQVVRFDRGILQKGKWTILQSGDCKRAGKTITEREWNVLTPEDKEQRKVVYTMLKGRPVRIQELFYHDPAQKPYKSETIKLEYQNGKITSMKSSTGQEYQFRYQKGLLMEMLDPSAPADLPLHYTYRPLAWDAQKNWTKMEYRSVTQQGESTVWVKRTIEYAAK